jgi:flagellar basal-body rod protein FlgC|tara:strand:- start:5095 stop:5502 length:408 start_codon:yes stop_codon:yes gene_type:complete
MDIYKSLDVSAAGMKVQGTRLRVVAENLANKDSTATKPGDEPYRRKIITFTDVFNKALGLNVVQVNSIDTDSGEFGKYYAPGHPAADEAGYIQKSNVNALIEMADMREAQRSYEANLKVLQSAKQMLEQTIAILR